jgi:hypothetical protein
MWILELICKLQEKCQLVTEVYKNVVVLQMKLSLFHSKLLNNNTYLSTLPKNISSLQEGYSWYVSQVLTDRFVDSDEDRTFADSFEASNEDK